MFFPPERLLCRKAARLWLLTFSPAPNSEQPTSRWALGTQAVHSLEDALLKPGFLELPRHPPQFYKNNNFSLFLCTQDLRGQLACSLSPSTMWERTLVARRGDARYLHLRSHLVVPTPFSLRQGLAVLLRRALNSCDQAILLPQPAF